MASVTQEEQKLLSRLENSFVNSEKTGNPVWRGASFAEMYFENGHEAEKRQALVGVWKRYFDLFPGQITHYLPNDGRRLATISDSHFPEHFRDILKTLGPEQFFDGRLLGYAWTSHTSWPTPFAISGVGAWQTERQKLSSLNCYFPLAFPFEKSQDLIEEILEWCELLRPRHGMVGLAMARQMGNPPYSTRDSLAFPFLKRFPGFDYTDPAQFSLLTRRANRQQIRGTNWLTIVDNAFVEELGGRQALDRDFAEAEEVTVHEWSDGILVQSGSVPELGDRNSGRMPQNYGKVAQAFAPIRFEDYEKKGYFRVPEPLDEVAETLAWVKRFDPAD